MARRCSFIQDGLRARLWGKFGNATLRPQMVYTGGGMPENNFERSHQRPQMPGMAYSMKSQRLRYILRGQELKGTAKSWKG